MRPSEVSKSLTALLPANRPVYVWGPPGCGKSSVVKQAADTLKLPLIHAARPGRPAGAAQTQR
jgi:MoxR-like ATPase